MASWWQQRCARLAHNSRSEPPARDLTAISINPLRFPSGSKAVSQRCSTTSKSTRLWRVAVKRGALGSAICHAAEDFSWNSLKDAIKSGLIGMASALIGPLEVKRNRGASAGSRSHYISSQLFGANYDVWLAAHSYVLYPRACVCHSGHNTRQHTKWNQTLVTNATSFFFWICLWLSASSICDGRWVKWGTQVIGHNAFPVAITLQSERSNKFCFFADTH